jgi:hypothetical protein
MLASTYHTIICRKKGVWGKLGDVNHAEAYVTNGGTSC